MERRKATSWILLYAGLALYLPGIAQAFDGHFEIGVGSTWSNPDIDNLSDGFLQDSDFDKTGQARHLLLATPLTQDLSLALGYRDFDTTLQSRSHAALTQRSKVYELQLDYAFYQQGDLSLHAWAGVANWHSSLEQRVGVQLDSTLYWSDSTEERTCGYTPKIGLGLTYQLTDQLSIGAKYDYYRRLGGGSTIIDRFSLLIGDLVGAATGHEPLEFSVETLELTLGFRF